MTPKDDNNKTAPYCRISVAMAVYNGEKYLPEQLDSIIPQLQSEDEIVISYDNSKDGTWALINDYAAKDPRIRVVINPDQGGHQRNFTNAVRNSRGRYIFFCDQDDFWIHDKIRKVLAIFTQTGCDLVIHDALISDGQLQVKRPEDTLFHLTSISKNPLRNWIKGTCWGCCMAFTSRMTDIICPFPPLFAHDIWTGILCGVFGKIEIIDDKLVIHRVHGNNVSTGRRKLAMIIKDRLLLAGALIRRIFNVVHRPNRVRTGSAI